MQISKQKQIELLTETLCTQCTNTDESRPYGECKPSEKCCYYGIAQNVIKNGYVKKEFLISDFIEKIKKHYSSEKYQPMYDEKHPYGKHTLIPALFALLDRVGDELVQEDKGE